MTRSWQAGDWVEALARAGLLSDIDRQLAIGLGRLDPDSGPLVLLAAALASRAVQQGHVCVDLADRGGRPPGAEVALSGLGWPELPGWREELLGSRLVGRGDAEPRPLVLTDGNLLYLQRYHHLEQRLAEWLRRRSGWTSFEREPLAEAVASPAAAGSDELDDQDLACVVALTRRVLLLSGGPGTGKTTTVARMLVLLARQAKGSDPTRERMRVLLLGPTGKATQRLATSLGSGLDRQRLDAESRAFIECRALTIHRALGYHSGPPLRFRHDADHPLAADVVVVDETSMVDLALMTRLVEAVRGDARLLLLGDEHQLASVEAGSIFGDICSGAAGIPRSALQAELLQQLRATNSSGEAASGSLPRIGREGAASVAVQAPESTSLRDSVVHLTRNYRYGDDSGIGRMARLIKAGDASGLLELLGTAPPDVVFHVVPDDQARPGPALESLIAELSRSGYAPYLSAEAPERKLDLLDRFRILTAHRTGPWGVEAVNALVERALVDCGLDPGASVYDNQPILVTRNDPQTGLYNGDVGLILGVRSGARAWFRTSAGLSDLSVARVSAFETVFAMTVHKSQGSEFDEVVVVLPPAASPLCSRELIYSGVTRARRRVHLIGSRASVRAAVARRTRRTSGLARLLWGEPLEQSG